MLKPEDIPQSLLRDLHGIRGFNEQSFIAAHQLPAPISVRFNPAKNIGLFSANQQVPWCSNGVYLSERPVFTLDPAFHAGAYYVQEASSMFLHHMLTSILPVRKGLRVLDLCAAPGGKSTLLASLLEADSLLISNEVIRTRTSILDENMARWGYMNTWVTGNDPRDFAKLPGYFDVIVVDAPCSGSGLWRKDARALNEWSEGNVQMCGERQQRILADVWPALKEGGILVYATCSYSSQEDEQILDWLAQEFEVQSLSVGVKEEWGITVTSSSKGMTGYRFFPGSVRGEGFFISALQKKEEVDELRVVKFKSVHDKKMHQLCSHLLEDADVSVLATGKDTYSAITPSHEADWIRLKNIVYLRRTGLKLGSFAAKEWLPDHEVALSIDSNKNLPHFNVSKEQALRFLKREDMGINAAEKGWHLIRYHGLGLGWVKSLGNRMNNYLPKHWRIRMDIDV